MTRSSFPLFNTPIDLAHQIWEKILIKNDLVIDATCGNGKDSLFLAKLLAALEGSLICIDIQGQAIEKTRDLLKKETPAFLPKVEFYEQSHETFPLCEKKPRLIVYNLGYLPSGNKNLTTLAETTKKSICEALNLLSEGGVLSITCYPGHLEGKKEEEILENFFSQLDPFLWCFTSFFWKNRNASPSLFLVQKKSSI